MLLPTVHSRPESGPAGPVELTDGGCQVWWGRRTDARPCLLELLDDAERARWRDIGHPQRRERYLAARALTRLVLAPLTGAAPQALRLRATCRGCGGPHGKPELVGFPSVELSVSHSAELVVVAVARGVRIGVDVEAQVLRSASIPLGALSRAEREVIATLAGPSRLAAFIRYWVRKEAVLKATGDGLTVPPARLTMSPPAQPAALQSWMDGPGDEFHLHDLDHRAGYAACVAGIGRQLTVSEHDGSDLLWAIH